MPITAKQYDEYNALKAKHERHANTGAYDQEEHAELGGLYEDLVRGYDYEARILEELATVREDIRMTKDSIKEMHTRIDQKVKLRRDARLMGTKGALARQTLEAVNRGEAVKVDGKVIIKSYEY